MVCKFSLVVKLDWNYNNVMLREGDDLQNEACVEVIDGELERPVTCFLDTQSNTAVGQFSIHNVLDQVQSYQ